MPPFLTTQPPWFVFLVHPRDHQDLHAVSGSSVVARHSATEEEFREKMLTLPPTVSGDVTFGFSPARGEVIVVLCMPDQILRDRGRAGIVAAVRLAAERGTSVIGLGALTAPATRGGQTLLPLLPELPRGITLTTGNAYTAATVRSNAVEAADALGLGTGARVAVIGCTGSVGVAATRLLAAHGFELILIGRSVSRVERELPELVPHALVSSDATDVRHADVSLLLTAEPAARLTSAMPRPGSVVIDFAHPFNINLEDYGTFLRRDIRVVQGGLVQIPDFSCTLDMRLPDRHCTLACLAETYLFAKEGIRDHSVGHASVDLALRLEQLAPRHGVRPRPLGLVPQPEAVAFG